MHRFADDDDGYLRWVTTNPTGYVVNVVRGGDSGGARILHGATCRTITGTPARGAQWTGPYIKVCGDLPELEAAFPPGSLKPCGICAPVRRASPSAAVAAPPATGVRPPSSPVAATNPVPKTWPSRYLRPSTDPMPLAVQPRLASWDRSQHPNQIALQYFLTTAADLVLPRIDGLADPLALRLDVGLPQPTQLLDAHDLDNYLYPLTTRLARLSGRAFATVWGTKQRGSDSFIRVEQAVEDPTAGEFTAVRLLDVDAPGQSTEFKQQIHNQIDGIGTLADGPVALQIAFVIPPGRNWAALWKPTIDALDPLLGRTRPDRDWHPRDGRIVELALHRHVRDDGARHVTIAIGAASVN